MDLKIQKIETSKDDISQPPLAEQGVIPKLTTSTILSGRSGSGKSMCLCNLLCREGFLRGYFDEIYVISPTALSDDVQKHVQKDLKIPKENVFIDVMKGIKHLENVLNLNRMIIEEFGADKAPIYAIIFDDVIGHKELMNHKFFTECFILARHFNISIFLCSQSFTQIPRRCRLQANNIILFAGSADEIRILSETHTPARYSKKEFIALVDYATELPYSFLYINLTQPQATRYRRNFDTVLELDRFKKTGEI